MTAGDDSPAVADGARHAAVGGLPRVADGGQVRAVLAGPDQHGLAAALEDQGIEVRRVEGLASRDSLDEAGIDGAALLVLTDADDASVIPVARERHPEIRIVAYADDSLPEFARPQVDLAVDPALLPADVVAEELH